MIKREIGAIPMRSRRCERGVYIISHFKREGDIGYDSEPEDLP